MCPKEQVDSAMLPRSILSAFPFRVRCAIHALPICLADPLQLQYLSAWKRTFWNSPLADRLPWITFSARRWLASILNDRMSVFEYGSGGSTLYFAEKVKHVYSVEHDPDWFATVSAELIAMGRKHVQYILEPPSSDSFDSPEYMSKRFPDQRASFRRYVDTIDLCPDQSLDLVFIDGRARNACAHRAIRKVRRGGWIVLDNSERADYRPALTLLGTHKRRDFTGMCPYGIDCWYTSAWCINY